MGNKAGHVNRLDVKTSSFARPAVNPRATTTKKPPPSKMAGAFLSAC